jgi:hypothetical protein
MEVKGKALTRSKIVVDFQIFEQVQTLIYLGNNISSLREVDVDDKIRNFNKINEIITIYFGKNMSKNIQLKLYKITANLALLFGSENGLRRKKIK